MDCFVASAPRNDVDTSEYNFDKSGYDFAISRHDLPELCQVSVPRKKEGAGKTGCALHPRSRVQLHTKMRTRAYRFSGNTPAFPAQWFYGLYRALPGDRLSCHRRFAGLTAKLDASIGASGPHDFAVRVSAFVSHTAASTAARPNVHDDREAPLLRAGMAQAGSADLPDEGRGIFF